MRATFHYSIDDVLSSLIEVTDYNLPLREHPFFKDLWLIHKEFKIQIGLHLFETTRMNGKNRHLREVRNLQSELVDEWLYFGPHATNDETPPYTQTIHEQRETFNSIFKEIRRIAGPFLSKSVRLHHYSESFELAEYFLQAGVKELFLTDRPVGSHRLDGGHKNRILEFGSTVVDDLILSRTHLRVENLANIKIRKHDFLYDVQKIVESHGRLVIYSHEYEHNRPEVIDTLYNVMSWLCLDLGMVCEAP